MARQSHIRDDVRRDKRVLIATPSYSGLSSPYVSSLLSSLPVLRKRGWSVDWIHLEGNCHVDDSRNDLVRAFLEGDCTHFMFIDADNSWAPDGLAELLEYGVDVVAGIYPARQSSDTFYAQLVPGRHDPRPDGLMRANRVPTGFLRFKRHVLQAMYDAEPRRFHGKNDKPGQIPMAAIFERTWEDGQRIGGDYTACDKWRAMGGEIFVAPEILLGHQGVKEWAGIYGTWLRRTHGLALRGVRNILDGELTPETMISLSMEWGNEPFQAHPGMLLALALTSRETKGPILEAGSGLSTLVLAAASGREVHSLENDPAWASHTASEARRHGLMNVHIHYAPIIAYEMRNGHRSVFENYTLPEGLPEGFGFAFCDGPTRNIQGHRRGFMEIFGNRILPNAPVIMDDADDPDILALANEWFPGVVNVVNDPTRPFIIARKTT